MEEDVLKKAMQGDINAFQSLFAEFQPQLKSYLYRLLADRNDVDDLTHDTFIKAYTSIGTFKADSSLKTWVFRIGTHLAYDHLGKRKRWQADNQEQTTAYISASSKAREALLDVRQNSVAGAFEIREHIDFCFTCMSKSLPVENQVALILKDIYDFSVREIAMILGKTQGVVKHLLNDARKDMMQIFDNRCALIGKNGVCHQCSELNGFFNPRLDHRQELMKLELSKGSKKYNREELFALRTLLIKTIDPLKASGTELHELAMKLTREAIGEK
ncbi:RNA polymerase sigma factor [Chitinophaga sp. GCM10012297]|uniref:RNA polymerase sigma factor n=1 Tax=Chitinophaga chungangae TaxID=2821488 RepID=A0ABS3YGL3_9BACT|nr:RNA polymerase sigma factor [Chitinophaga chungangae]MBO9153828.1 RNA polymerase sigma factor [Chitinophaga chungangae]